MSDNNQIKSAQGMFRVGRIEKRHAEAAAKAVAKEIMQERSRKADMTAYESAKEEAQNAALIDLIEQRYHATHRRELPELISLARRVERVHAGNPDVPAGLADLLTTMDAELGDHMAKEENVLFPMMRRGGHPMIAQPIAMMRDEHDDHGEHLEAMERITQGGVPPEGACNSWRALYAGTRKFAEDLIEHVHIENNILFPRFVG